MTPAAWCRKELAHVLCHAPDTCPEGLTRAVAEVEAESVAYIVTAAAGLDSGGYTVPYVAGWAGGDLTLLQASATRTLSAARQVLDRAGPAWTAPTPAALARQATRDGDRSGERSTGRRRTGRAPAERRRAPAGRGRER